MGSRQVAMFVTARILTDGEPVSTEPLYQRPVYAPVGKEFRQALKDYLTEQQKGKANP